MLALFQCVFWLLCIWLLFHVSICFHIRSVDRYVWSMVFVEYYTDDEYPNKSYVRHIYVSYTYPYARKHLQCHPKNKCTCDRFTPFHSHSVFLDLNFCSPRACHSVFHFVLLLLLSSFFTSSFHFSSLVSEAVSFSLVCALALQSL